MRDTLTDPRLARYAGQFVWLELNFDRPENQDFLMRHAVLNTPSFFIIDPVSGRVMATQVTAMTFNELTAFLERAETAITRNRAPADIVYSEADALLAANKLADATTAFRRALSIGGKSWAQRDEAIGSLTWALKSNQQWQECAATAVGEAPHMERGASFGKLVLAGIMCVYQGGSDEWTKSVREILEPLAEEAVVLPAIARDHRFELYQNLMMLADTRNDKKRVAILGDRWLGELDATKPKNDDERSALDIARVDVESILGDPGRVLPALAESERAMPTNFNASLRLAQMEILAKQLDDAIGACNRGLAHTTGPLGRSWLLQIQADALLQKGDTKAGRLALEKALREAEHISVTGPRRNNVARIRKRLSSIDGQENK